MWGRVSAEVLNTNRQKCRCSRTYPQREQLPCLAGSLRSNKRNGLGCRHLTSPLGLRLKVADCQVSHLAASWPWRCLYNPAVVHRGTLRSTSLLMGLSMLAARSHLRFIRFLPTGWGYQWVFAHPLLAVGHDKPAVSRYICCQIWPCANHRRERRSHWTWILYMTGSVISKSVLKWYKPPCWRPQSPPSFLLTNAVLFPELLFRLEKKSIHSLALRTQRRGGEDRFKPLQENFKNIVDQGLCTPSSLREH